MKKLKNILTSQIVQTTISLFFVLFLLEVFISVLGIRAYILPKPSQIFAAMIKSHALLFKGASYTIRSLLIGYLLAVLLGVLLALPIAFSRFMQRIVYPLLVLSQLVPKVALAPIFVIWFGFGLLPKVMIVFLLAFFSVLLNSIVGLKSINREIVFMAQSTGAKPVDMFFKVRLPTSLPSMFAGFKLAAISATIGSVIGEFIGSDAGLGFIILTANGDMQTDLSFASIFVITMLGFLLYYAVELLEKLCIPWHISQRGEAREAV